MTTTQNTTTDVGTMNTTQNTTTDVGTMTTTQNTTTDVGTMTTTENINAPDVNTITDNTPPSLPQGFTIEDGGSLDFAETETETADLSLSIDVKELLESYLAYGKILILVNSHVQGVQLPADCMDKIQIKLNLSHKFQTNIFEIDDKEVRVDLSFGGVRQLCILPLHAIYYVAMADNPLEGVEIVEHMPTEILEAMFIQNQIIQKRDEELSKEIDFLSCIPKEKAAKIEKGIKKRMSITPPSFDADEKSFEDFMDLFQNEDFRDVMSRISELQQGKTKSKKKKADNEIRISDFLKKKKAQKNQK